MEIQGLEKILKAGANRQRLAILRHLKKEQEASVSDIKGAIKLSFKSTSQHLRTLAAAGIIERDQKGHFGYYHLAKNQYPIIRNILSLL